MVRNCLVSCSLDISMRHFTPTLPHVATERLPNVVRNESAGLFKTKVQAVFLTALYTYTICTVISER